MIISLIELFLGREGLGLVNVIDPTQDIRVTEFTELVLPLRRGEFKNLALRRILDGNRGKLGEGTSHGRLCQFWVILDVCGETLRPTRHV
jgi:hypothetical protein